MVILCNFIMIILLIFLPADCSPNDEYKAQLEDHLETEIDFRTPRSFVKNIYKYLWSRQEGFGHIQYKDSYGNIMSSRVSWDDYGLEYWYETRIKNSICPQTPTGIAAMFDIAIMIPCMFGNVTKEPRTIYVHTYFLHHLFESTFRGFPQDWRFVLVSSGSDMTIPRGVLDSRYRNQRGFDQDGGFGFRALVDDPRVIHWFIENHDYDHPKISSLPTGMPPDVTNSIPSSIHPLSERPLRFLLIDRVREGTGQWFDRWNVSEMCKNSLYCQRPFYGSQAFDGTTHQDFVDNIVSLPFVLCVHGGGIDPSPKAFEAIFLGTIPIIKRGFIDDAYGQLPVAWVDDWSELFYNPNIEDRLVEWIRTLGPFYEDGSELRQSVLYKLTSEYWYKQIEKKYFEYKLEGIPLESNSTSDQDSKRCSFSIIDAITNCDDGKIGVGPNCDCGVSNCELRYMTSFLPSQLLYMSEYRSENRKICDKNMSSEFGRVLLSKSIITKKQGYPFNKVCSGADDQRCHSPSIGKYIRYQSLMEYSVNGFRGDFSSNGSNKNNFVDIGFPNGWIWTTDVDECKSVNRDGSWNCLFESVTDIDDSQKSTVASQSLDTFEKIFKIRQNYTNNVAQLMIYGKIIDLISRPSDVVKDYMQKNVVSINKHLHNQNYPSVSMHVKQGDSCTNSSNGRKCFSIEIYMKQLYQIRDLYGVKRVYLATDSEEMIARALREGDFNWVFLNISRDLFKSGEYIDIRMKKNIILRGTAAFSAVSDLELMRQGDIFLGAFSGHFSKTAYYLMSGSRMKLIPFVSIDFTLDCDQLDNCNDEIISSRRHDIYDMIFWAPECIRNAIKWSPRWREDPCGIYNDVGA